MDGAQSDFRRDRPSLAHTDRHRGADHRRRGGGAGSVAQPSAPVERPVPVTLRPAIDRPATVFEGWGTALARFAHVTGGWPEAERTRLADLFYGADGTGWTIARYNIGGGNAADTPPYMKVGRAVPGFWRQPAG